MKILKPITLTKIIFVLVFTLIIADSFAQFETYRTNMGTLKINANINEKLVVITSKQLLITLDYETGNFKMKQEISSLQTNNDSIQQKLNQQTNKFISLEGKLDIEYVNTQDHAPMSFKVEGTIVPSDKHIIGSGKLIHMVEGSSAACLLSLSFSIESANIFDEEISRHIKNAIQVYVLQTLMARSSD